MKFALSLLSALLILTGCATWEGLSPGAQAALKGAAKVALSLAVTKLGESVHELRPYQDKLNGILNVTFSKALPPEAIGSDLKRRVGLAVPVQHQAAVLAEFKRALAEAQPAAGPSQPADFNRRLAASL